MPVAKVNEVNISYKVRGQGEPLVLIQGLGGPSSGWIAQVRAFGKYYRVITLDSRGVGKSDKPSEGYTVKTMANDTMGLLEHLDVEKAHVLGVSLGGMVAQEMAINYPERVRKLILASTTADTGDTDGTVARAMGLSHDSTGRELEGADMGRVMSAVISLSFNRRLFRVFFVPLSKIYCRFMGVGGIGGQLEAAASYGTLDRLHRIKAPTMVIAGTGDRLIPFRSSEVLAERIPGARLVSVEGGSHAMFLEMRGRFNREVLDFLSGG